MNAYNTFIAEIRDMIGPHLRPDLDADRYARGIAEELDYFENAVHFEIRGAHTATGNPITFNIGIPSALRETADE